MSALATVKARFAEIYDRVPKFGVALALAVLAAITLTLISLEIYVLSGAASLDASLPGYEQTRQHITRQEADTTEFSSSGQLDKKAYDTFYSLYDKRIKGLSGNNIGTFSDQSLGNPNIGLIKNVAPAE